MQSSVAQDPVELAVGNWHRFGWGAVESMAAATSITRVHQVMTARIDAALKPLGLNFSRFEVLALLSFTREGQLPMGKIGDRLQVNAASVTNTIGRLEADGLVERVAHPTDGRATLARILEPGREAAARAAVALAEIHFGLDGLGPRETASVTEAFGGFRRANGDFA